MKIKNNVITEGFSGKLGNKVVFRTRGEKTVVSRPPQKKTGPLPESQQITISKFRLAVVYAKAAIANAALKKEYEDKRRGDESAYNRAIADFFHAPVISDADVKAYTGKIGDKILVKAYDDFRLVSVEVNIQKANGTLVEQGQCVWDPQSLVYVFTATAANDTLSGSKITVTATDLPANKTVKTVVMA